jgi:hypothetical protein
MMRRWQPRRPALSILGAAGGCLEPCPAPEGRPSASAALAFFGSYFGLETGAGSPESVSKKSLKPRPGLG